MLRATLGWGGQGAGTAPVFSFLVPDLGNSPGALRLTKWGIEGLTTMMWTSGLEWAPTFCAGQRELEKH